MKLWHWVVAVFVLYEGVIGISELLALSGSNPLAGLSSWPSVGSLVQQNTSISTAVAGGVDLGLAIVLYVFVLHDHLLRTLVRP